MEEEENAGMSRVTALNNRIRNAAVGESTVGGKLRDVHPVAGR